MNSNPGRHAQLVEVDVVPLAQLRARLDRLRERLDERRLVLDRRVDPIVGGRRSVDRERLLEIAEDPDVVDDEPVLLLGEDAVRARDRLHERVVPHRAVEVDRRAARRVEARHPHRADEDEPERIARILEPLVERLRDHPRPVRADVEPHALHLGDLVLPLADDDRHVRRLHELDPRWRARPARAPAARRARRAAPRGDRGHSSLHEGVHPHRRRLVDRDDHRLAVEAAPDEVADEVARDRPQPLGPRDERDLPREAPNEQALGLVVDLGLLEDRVQLLVEGLVDELELGDAVLVVERDGRAVRDRVAEVVDRDVVAELALRELLADDERRAGEAHERRVRQGLAHVLGEHVVLACGAPRR